MTLNRKAFGIAALGAASALLGGCDAPVAQAPRHDVVLAADQAPQDFAGRDIDFKDVQLLLFKKDADPAQLAQVIRASQDLEDANDAYFIGARAQATVRARFDAVGVDPGQLLEDLADLPGRQAQHDQQKAKLDAELAKPQAEQNAALIARLTARVKMLQDQIDATRASKKKVDDSGLADELTAWQTRSQDVAARQDRSRQTLQALDPLVWIYNSTPIKFSFRFPADGSIQAAIHNWDLSDIGDIASAEAQGGSKDFSTEDGTIEKVTYAPHGGVFTFEVLAPSAVFYFKLYRAKYGDVDGRVHAKAQITRCSVDGPGRPVVVHVRDFVECGVEPQGMGQPVLRMGSATLADQSSQAQ